MKPLSCPYFVTTKGGQEQFPGKRVTIFLQSDNMATCVLTARLCGYHSKAVFISLESPQTSVTAGKGTYTSDTVTTVRCWQ